ncbi:MAG: V-type ATPase subunit [Oscillibacter sp.]|nr:V-type ATPase subunit [Oscillibacter sp.]
MANKQRQTDYLTVSARIRILETRLLSPAQMEQMLTARTDEEVVRLLRESGYPELDPSNPAGLDAALSQVREHTLEDLADMVPDSLYLDLFRLKYDYHNVKSLLKAEAVGADPEHMLTDLGRVPAAALRTALEGETDEALLPPMLLSAAREMRETLETTRDPQLADMAADAWYYRELADLAERPGSEFLRGYVRLQIDAVNLRVLVRTQRMGKNAAFACGALFAGGEIDAEALLAVSQAHGQGLAKLYETSVLRAAAEEGQRVLQGAAPTEFEKLCDDAVSGYLARSRYVPFGEEPLVSYLAARETEYLNLRILLMGRRAGLDPETIRARLRKSCL